LTPSLQSSGTQTALSQILPAPHSSSVSKSWPLLQTRTFVLSSLHCFVPTLQVVVLPPRQMLFTQSALLAHGLCSEHVSRHLPFSQIWSDEQLHVGVLSCEESVQPAAHKHTNIISDSFFILCPLPWDIAQ
jgi:hypothetical protein